MRPIEGASLQLRTPTFVPGPPFMTGGGAYRVGRSPPSELAVAKMSRLLAVRIIRCIVAPLFKRNELSPLECPPMSLLFSRPRVRNSTQPAPDAIRSNVRFGSEADTCNANRDVRFAPESDIKCDIIECPLWARSGHRFRELKVVHRVPFPSGSCHRRSRQRDFVGRRLTAL